MFDFNLWELLVIFIVALVVLGPEKMTALAFHLGRWLNYLQNMWKHASTEMKKQMEKPNPKDESPHGPT